MPNLVLLKYRYNVFFSFHYFSFLGVGSGANKHFELSERDVIGLGMHIMIVVDSQKVNFKIKKQLMRSDFVLLMEI